MGTFPPSRCSDRHADCRNNQRIICRSYSQFSKHTRGAILPLNANEISRTAFHRTPEGDREIHPERQRDIREKKKIPAISRMRWFRFRLKNVNKYEILEIVSLPSRRVFALQKTRFSRRIFERNFLSQKGYSRSKCLLPPYPFTSPLRACPKKDTAVVNVLSKRQNYIYQGGLKFCPSKHRHLLDINLSILGVRRRCNQLHKNVQIGKKLPKNRLGILTPRKGE